MDKDTFLANHERETARLGRVIDELTHSTPTNLTPITVAIIEGKVDLLRSLGVRLKSVAELEMKMAAMKEEVFA